MAPEGARRWKRGWLRYVRHDGARAPIAALALIALCLVTPTVARAKPLVDLRPNEPVVAHPGESLVIRGHISGDGAASLVLRVEDGKSNNYPSRVNEERQMPPGPFVWHYQLAGARASNGRSLDPSDIRRVMLFEPDDTNRIEVDSAEIEPGPNFPPNAIGYALGAADAPLIGGLTRLGPDDPRIINGHPHAVRRPGPDPIIGNGVIGVEKLKLAFPRGRARVSLWTEDVGEWETLPHPLQRRVRVNGVDLEYDLLTAQQWIETRYLAGRDREAGPGEDAWSAYGRYRGGLVSGEVEVGDDGVTIELAGEGAASTFLSAIVIEPAGETEGRDAVQAARRQWMVENFPILPARAGAPLPTLGDKPASLSAFVAPGTGARVEFRVAGGAVDATPKIEIENPLLSGARLKVALYAAQQRLDRVSVGATLLKREDHTLRGDPAVLAIRSNEPRRYVAWVRAPEGAAPGVYRGRITFDVGGKKREASLAIEVPRVVLPAPQSPAGFYLDEAPHLTWFEATRPERGPQLEADLATLSRFGVLGDAPGLATPDATEAFQDDMARAGRAGLAAPWLAYAPLKRLVADDGGEGAAQELARVLPKLDVAPVWALFDEPGNVGGGAEGAAALAAKLRAAAPRIKLAGQFNSPHDVHFLDAVDVAVVNPGFGVDAETIAGLQESGHEAWIYNTGAPRFTAGLWLWRTHASRYLQWHARMPTADPFDPTDGREGDAQVFPPMPHVDSEHEDIDESLIEMAEGLVDQRWLEWLQSRPEPKAKALVREITSKLPADWASASGEGREKALTVRARIEKLARDLR